MFAGIGSEENTVVTEERILWIIRWTDLEPQRMECKTCTREEAEDYARKKSEKEKLGRYVIV